MKTFKLTRLCTNCPFRKDDKAIPLQPGRREGIIEDLLTNKTDHFPCHGTVHRKDGRNFDENERYVANDVQHCPGAVAVCSKYGREPQMVQIAKRLGVIPWDHYDQAMEESLGPEDVVVDREKCHLPND